MAEFRRLISYIYEYEGHVKGKNVGFVKLEARNGLCKLNVNVKKLYMGSGDMGVYLMTGRQEIFLGNIFLRNGAGEFRTMVQVTDVQESGETMDECYGLTLHGKGENWRVYTTIWEDAVAQAAQLTLESVTSEQTLENEVEKGKLSPVIYDPEEKKEEGLGIRQEKGPREAGVTGMLPQGQPEKKEMVQGRPAAQEQEPQQQEVLPESWQPQGDDLPSEMGNPQSPTGSQGTVTGSQMSWPESEKIQPEGQESQAENRESTSENKESLSGLQESPSGNRGSQLEPQKPQSENQQIPLKVQRPPAKSQLLGPEGRRQGDSAGQLQVTGAEILHKPETGREKEIPNFEMGQLEMETENPEIPLKQQVQAPVIRQHKETALIIGDPEALAKLDAEDASEHQMPVWEFFLKTYPKIQAFDSQHGCVILVIKPQDIGLLPREVWIYGNNSFLLHGYYNYRYLILARLENPHGNARYLLGIPGHYYNNEKYMASMFGFPHFVLSKKQTADDGRFGYWYTDIRMGDGAMLQSDAVKSLKNQTM